MSQRVEWVLTCLDRMNQKHYCFCPVRLHDIYSLTVPKVLLPFLHRNMVATPCLLHICFALDQHRSTHLANCSLGTKDRRMDCHIQIDIEIENRLWHKTVHDFLHDITVHVLPLLFCITLRPGTPIKYINVAFSCGKTYRSIHR